MTAPKAPALARPVTDDPAYDAAMNALHDATSESYAWDVAWAPEAMQDKLYRALRILGAAILTASADYAALRSLNADLLAALLGVMPFVRMYEPPDSTMEEWDLAVNAGEAALRKATGQEVD